MWVQQQVQQQVLTMQVWEPVTDPDSIPVHLPQEFREGFLRCFPYRNYLTLRNLCREILKKS